MGTKQWVVVLELAKRWGLNAATVSRWAKRLGYEVETKTMPGFGGQKVRVISLDCMRKIEQERAAQSQGYVDLDTLGGGAKRSEEITVRIEQRLLKKIDAAAAVESLSRTTWITKQLWKGVK